MPVGKKSIQRAIDAQNKTEQSAPKAQAKASAPAKKAPELTMVELSAISCEGRTGVYELEKLKSSMRAYGMIAPILLVCDGKTCRLADGYGRYLAAKELGWSKILAIVIPGNKAAFENLQRELSGSIRREEASACGSIHEEKFRVISRISSEVPVELL